MMSVPTRLTLIIAALSIGMLPRPALAQVLPGWNQRSFNAEQNGDIVTLQREVEIEGEAGGPNAGQKFFADALKMNVKTGEIIADGNVVFSTPTARLSADSVVFNTKTRRGIFNTASGIAQLGERGERNRSMFGTLEPDVYFWGATIEKISDDEYRLTKGGFTTCVQPTARWQIISGSATLKLDDYVIMRNAVVQVKDVPVFYLPMLYYPIQEDERATGFLLPSYGSSQVMGSSISNAFFWAINRSHDATFFHDWMFSRGQGLGAEYRYLLGPRAMGDFRYYTLDEKETIINGQTRNARQSKTIRGNLSQSLPFGLSLRGRVDYFSNLTVQQTYNRDFYNATNSSRTFQGGISGAWRQLSVNGTISRTQSFLNFDSSSTQGQTPGATLALSGVRFGRLPLFAYVNAEAGREVLIYDYPDLKKDATLNRFFLLPTLRAPLSTLPFLQVNAVISSPMAHYSQSLTERGDQVEVPITRRYTEMGVEVVGPIVSKIYNLNNVVADRMKHLIEPSFSIQRRTAIPNNKLIPAFNTIDQVAGGFTQMSYGISSRLLARKDSDASAAAATPSANAPRDLLSVSLRQTYFTDAQASTFDRTATFSFARRAANSFSPVFLVVRGSPVKPVFIDYRVEYDANPAGPLEPQMLGMGLNGSFRTDWAQISAGWNRSAFANYSQVLASKYFETSSKLTFKQDRFGGLVQFNFDMVRATLLNQRYLAYYNPQCCGVSFEYQAVNFPRIPGQFPLPSDRRFNMSFTLAGVGSFSNFFGAFGGTSGMR